MMRRLLLALLLLFGALRAVAADDVPTLTVVGDAAPPFRIFAGAEPRGIYFDLIKRLAQRVGCRLRFVEVPPARALAMMRQGEADLMIGLLLTPERAAFLHYLQPNLPPVDKRFLVRPDGPRIERYEDLAKLQIGVEMGKSYSPTFDHDAKLSKDVSDNYAAALRKLRAGRIDTVVIPEAEADWMMREMQLHFDKAPYRIVGQPTYLTLSRASPHQRLLAPLEQALSELAAAGEFAALMQRYR